MYCTVIEQEFSTSDPIICSSSRITVPELDGVVKGKRMPYRVCWVIIILTGLCGYNGKIDFCVLLDINVCMQRLPWPRGNRGQRFLRQLFGWRCVRH